jgi:hypothetical protein
MEMDWAICSVIEDRIGDNELDVQLRCNESGASAFQLARAVLHKTRRIRRTCAPRLAKFWRYRGAFPWANKSLSDWARLTMSGMDTSGNAVGGFRSSFEWTIVRPAAKSIREWNEGGMGVDGDSGSWIVREHSNELMGMLWGRYQDDDIEDPITFFTPIHDVFDDIIDAWAQANRIAQEQNPSTSALRAGSLNSAASRYL